MKKLKVKDSLVRAAANKKELHRKVLKNVQNNFNLLLGVRWKAADALLKSKGLTSKTRINNRCIQTISKKTFNKYYRVSRLMFLKYVRAGEVLGFYKSSW